MEIIEIGKGAYIDLPRLVKTRLLIQANSGGGKSYLIRKLLEETHGKIQQIVLDMEGEFASLREKYDYILVGEEGDIPISIRSAELLATKLLELNTSAIIDLYELKHHERVLFVKRFLDSLINAPKNLWHPCLVVVDEAHVFCPEKGQVESFSSVIDLATRGRKRGYVGVLATQRLSKLHKDAAAEMGNKLIGRTGLDIDMKRASDELGFVSKQQMLELRDLEPGEFFAFGPAISKTIRKIKVGKVKTTHPEAGLTQLSQPIPPPPDKIKAILSKLGDLPQQAEEELKTKEQMKKKIRELKIELRRKPKPTVHVDENALQRAELRGFKNAERQYKDGIKSQTNAIRALMNKLNKISAILEIGEAIKIDAPKTVMPPAPKPREIIPEKPTPDLSEVRTEQPEVRTLEPEEELGKCEKAIYSLLFNNQGREFTKQNVALFTGYSHKSGGFSSAISHLTAMGLIRKSNNLLSVNEDMMHEGIRLLGDDINLYEEFTIENWGNKLPKCESKIFKFLMENPDQEFSKEELGEQTGYSHSSGGFNSAVYRLNSLGLIKKENNMIKLNAEILEKA